MTYMLFCDRIFYVIIQLIKKKMWLFILIIWLFILIIWLVSHLISMACCAHNDSISFSDAMLVKYISFIYISCGYGNYFLIQRLILQLNNKISSMPPLHIISFLGMINNKLFPFKAHSLVKIGGQYFMFFSYYFQIILLKSIQIVIAFAHLNN